ncbi:hypothetical protein IJG04_00420 [Candidatus Saccharibacteria bacterium]|nr:hypothetical protein [Candidatus Saccharibacteria bacterium]
MSMVQQLISAVTNAERQIDDQMSKLRSYGAEIDQVTQRVQADFSGSQRDYGQKMLQQLSTTKRQVDETMARLQTAKEKLTQVRMI